MKTKKIVFEKPKSSASIVYRVKRLVNLSEPAIGTYHPIETVTRWCRDPKVQVEVV